MREYGLFAGRSGNWEPRPVPDLEDLEESTMEDDMKDYIAFLSDGTRYTITAESGGAARRMVARRIRKCEPPFTSPDVTIFRIRVVNR